MKENIQDVIRDIEKEVERRKDGPYGAAFDESELKSWLDRMKTASADIPDHDLVSKVAAVAVALAISVDNYHTTLKRVSEEAGKELPASISLAMILEEGMVNMVMSGAKTILGKDGQGIFDGLAAIKHAHASAAGSKEPQEEKR